MIYLWLIIEFIKISLFSFGGGYGTLPFIYYIANQYGWYETKEIMHMIAISAITPGAFGVNMATYSGFKTAGIIGSLIATSSLVVPSAILSIAVYKILKKYKNSQIFQSALETLRAVASGLLFAVLLQMINQEIIHMNLRDLSINFDYRALIFLILSIIIYFIVRKNIPITMLLTLFFGIIFKNFGII